jgi:hypothetical protein
VETLDFRSAVGEFAGHALAIADIADDTDGADYVVVLDEEAGGGLAGDVLASRRHHGYFVGHALVC